MAIPALPERSFEECLTRLPFIWECPLGWVPRSFGHAWRPVLGHLNATSTGLTAGIALMLGDFGGGARRALRYLHATSVAVHSCPTLVQRTPTCRQWRPTEPPRRCTANPSRPPPAQAAPTASNPGPTRARPDATPSRSQPPGCMRPSLPSTAGPRSPPGRTPRRTWRRPLASPPPRPLARPPRLYTFLTRVQNQGVRASRGAAPTANDGPFSITAGPPSPPAPP